VRNRIIALTLVAVTTLPALAAKIEKKTLTSRGHERTYSLFVPDGLTAESPAPLIITLHGSGRNGASLVEKWKGLAEKENIILVGPDSTNSAHWAAPDDGPVLLRDLVDDVSKQFPVDQRRIFLFGHSAGAGFALQIALLQSEYFAAVGVHAGDMRPEEFSLVSFARRKIPFAMIVGTNDQLFPLESVRATRDNLVENGFEVELTELKRHTHDYYSRAASINDTIWQFLEKRALPGAPKFVDYANMR